MIETLYADGHRKIVLYFYTTHENYLAGIVKKAKEELKELELIPIALSHMTDIRPDLIADFRKYVDVYKRQVYPCNKISCIPSLS